LPFFSYLLGKAIAEKLNVDVTQAAQLLRKIGLLESREYGTKVRLAVAPLLNTFLEDVRRHVAFFNKERTEGEHDALNIDSVLLSGGGSYIAGIEKYLGVGLKLAVAKTNPLTNIAAEENKAYAFMHEQSLRYSVALGTALRGVEGDISDLFKAQ
jgi:Tfp pilus assembly PilM family ATPase